MEFVWCLIPPELTLDPLSREVRAGTDIPVGKKFLPLLGTLVPIPAIGLEELDKDDVKCKLGGYDYRHIVNDSHVRISNWVRFIRTTNDHKEANVHKTATSDDGNDFVFVVIRRINLGGPIMIFVSECLKEDDAMVKYETDSIPEERTIDEAPLDLRKSPASLQGYAHCPASFSATSKKQNGGFSSTHESSSVEPGPSRRRERPMLPCGVCGKLFDRPSLLKRHMRTHTGEKPHACDVCQKAFSTSSSLNTHRRIHSGERPHECPICFKRFTASSNLYYHRMTHVKDKPHKCVECGKSFPTPGDLKSHTYVHSGSWPFRCPICSRGFSKQTNMRNHLFLHTGNKPHSCERCGKRFALACNLRAHARTHDEDTSRTDAATLAANQIPINPLAQAVLIAQGLLGISGGFSAAGAVALSRPKEEFLEKLLSRSK